MKPDFSNMRYLGKMILTDRVNGDLSAVNVVIYGDPDAKRVYHHNEQGLEYRYAEVSSSIDSASYG